MDIIQLTGLGLVFLIALFAFIGFWLKRRVKSSEDFLLAGRNAPFWLLASAYIGGAIGGASVSGYTGYGFSSGISSMWTSIFVVSGMTLFVVLFARRLNYFGRKNNAVTIGDFICARYGERMRIPVALSSCFRPLFLTGLQFLGIAVALKVTFNLDLVYGVPLAAASISLYMVTSGQYAALITQWIQSILQSLSILLFVFAAFKFFGAPAEVSNAIYSELPPGFLNFWNVDFSLFSIWLLSFGVFYLVDPWIYMWAYIGRSPRVASNAQLAILGCSYFNVLPFIAGLVLAVAVLVEKLAVPETISSDGLYVWFTINHINLLVGTLIMVGLFMTILSCGSSFAMNGVTVLTRDVYERVINPNATPEQSMKASRISVLLVIFFGIFSALWLPVLIPLWILAQAICLSGLMGPTISAWFWKRATTTGAFCSCLIGVVASVSWAVLVWVKTGSPGGTIHGLHAVHIGLLFSIPTMIIVSLLTKHDQAESVEATNFKTLGLEMEALNHKPEHNELKKRFSVFEWLSAETSFQKLAWILVFTAFILHYILSFFFHIPWVGEITIWVSLVTGIIMVFALAVMGGRDIVTLVKGFLAIPDDRSNQ